jgi:hypothetical protein
LALTDPKYRQLARLAAENLGGSPGESLDEAIRWLNINSMETEWADVINEINFCRDLVK